MHALWAEIVYAHRGLMQTACTLRPTALVPEVAQDNFQAIIGAIKALDLLRSRHFQGPKSLGHPGLSMGQAVVTSGHNRAEPEGTHPAQAEPLPGAMGGTVLVNPRRQCQPLHLFE